MNWIVLLLLALLAPEKEFHQGVDYTLEARLDESTNVLTGRGELRYTNRSPEKLDTLYFHLHLNAFRPNSAWAQRELQFNNRRFQDLGANDHAYDRVSSITVNGARVTPVFPFAPDSTVMAVPLPAPLAPARSVVVRMDWTSRLSTVPRRQGRSGRHYDWAHWYPRIAVYDTTGWQYNKLVPQGEFYGEFASYDVTLDVAADQVMGATGVPVSGDPGWERANKNRTLAPVLRRDAYASRAARSLGLLGKVGDGRKQVRWRADNVHHFAWLTDPAFVYEGSTHGEVAIHNLYLPNDSLWRDGIAVVKRSLDFYEGVLGPYVYPQLTSARRLEGGGTEFPMLNMNGAAPPIVHEVGHEWAHAILANNEFREGWLDEGFDSFLGDLYQQAQGRAPRYEQLAAVARLDSAGLSQPIASHSAEFRDFNTYGAMTYTKPSLVFRMLHWYLGDAPFRAGLKLYYEQNKLQHVDEADFRRAMEQSGKQDLGWFFQQWLHTTGTLDYAIANATTKQVSSGAWQTTVQVTRTGDIWMPVELKVGDKNVRLDSREREFTTVVETAAKPDAAVLDPDFVLIDIVRGNNRKQLN